MAFRKQIWLAFATAPVLVALLAAPTLSRAEGSVRCQVTKGDKTETKEVTSAAECTKLGGQVVTKADDLEKRK